MKLLEESQIGAQATGSSENALLIVPKVNIIFFFKLLQTNEMQ